MKKILLTFVLLTVILIGTSAKVHATTVSIYVNITLIDSCGSGYTGDYCVQLKLYYNGSPISSGYTNCTITKGGPTCKRFDFDIPDNLADHYYEIFAVGGSRVGGTCSTPIGQLYGYPGLWWSQLTDCSQYLTIVLK